MTDQPRFGRRPLLGALAGAGVTTLAGCSALSPGDDATPTAVPEDEALSLVTEFAPVLYFDAAERWFPTDPRRYESERDGETVVDGFDAFDGYVSAFSDPESPPEPTLFYNVVGYEDSSLAVVQYWAYSVFDQFTTNFHWHDWEVLHVFVDRDSGTPQLLVASSHSRKVPNNEFLDPPADQAPRILTELGSHSSALSLNDTPDRFQRFPTGGSAADITNSAIGVLENLAEFPLAYGLPRDEGSRLPYVVPELEGEPVYEHPDLPSVDRTSLVDEALTVRSFEELSSPPTDLPARSTGLTFGHEGVDADVTYRLVPTAEVEHVTAFTGPQLSFEFAIPQFAEDAIASHLTTTPPPWTQPRYENPAADISDPEHRKALAERYDAIGDPAPVNALVTTVSQAVTTEDAPDGEGLTTDSLSVEAVALLESDPEAVPTTNGVVVVQDVPEGEHRLTVNGAGVAPHSEGLSVGAEGTTTAGVDGEIPLVARADATKLEVDTEGTDRDLTDLAVEDDFAGRLYDAPLSGPDAVYVHRGGAYTTEVRDSDDEVGAFRVNPSDEATVRIANPSTGKATLATFLADISSETATAVRAVAEESDGSESGGGEPTSVQGLARALEAVSDSARQAADRAASGDRGRSDETLRTVVDRLGRAEERLSEARDELPSVLGNATERRLEQADRRAEQALDSNKL